MYSFKVYVFYDVVLYQKSGQQSAHENHAKCLQTICFSIVFSFAIEL